MLDNPTLWSILSVAFGAAPQKPNGRVIHIFLERSQTTPLIVHMRLPSTLPSRKIIRHPAFQALIRDAPRWKMLRLIGDPRILRKDHPMRAVESLPKLEVLSLENMESETVTDFQVIPMPNLCRLIVITPRERIAVQSNFPWTQLTSMRLHGLHNVPSLVQLCPNLIELGLILSSELGEALPNHPVVIRHKRMRLLSLWFVKDPNMPKVKKKLLDMLEFPFDYFCCPVL
ncbi:hypothetical protein BDP27DRAFT_1425519 [Rhodocollybia butyracea]|uniref:Uncharacterized protein n=1 Tax=Rhodocollybia butyracea TaxID=206335 RepID=A0A9P5U3M6_9AGAR|nr:hypothetical protein BDP27DRAFT_1425519 [Rhodocollybia butyracea]